MVRLSDGVTIGMITAIEKGCYAILWGGTVAWLVPAQIKKVIRESR
jgi:hypothetical protein